MEVEKFDDISLYQWSSKIRKIASAAARNAVEENKRLGVPSAFSSDGVPFYQMPNGEITTENPFK